MHYKKRKLHKLHSIPIGLCNKVNHNRLYLVSYSIPLACIVVLLLTGIIAVNPSLSLKTSAVTIQDEWVVKDNGSDSIPEDSADPNSKKPNADSKIKTLNSDSIPAQDANDANRFNNSNSANSNNYDNLSDGSTAQTVNEDNPSDSDQGIMPLSIASDSSGAGSSSTPSISITVTAGTGGNGGGVDQVVNAFQGGGTVYRSHNVTVQGTMLKDYSLVLTGPTNLTMPSGASSSTSTISGAGGKTGSNLTTNTWGYAWGNTTDTDSNMTYNSLSSSGTTISNNSTNSIASDKSLNFTKKLVFAAKFGDVAPGNYTANVTLSAVATPVMTMSSISNMQDMTAEICTTSSIGQTATLTDNREGYNIGIMVGASGVSHNLNQYEIVKHTDGNCWMQENLRIGKGSSVSLSSSNTDLATGTSSWTLPASKDDDWSSTNSVAQVRAGSTSMSGWQQLYGNFYSWCAATAGSCSAVVDDKYEADGSICPRGWELPTRGQYNGLINGLDVVTITTKPYYFALSGEVSSSKSYESAGNVVYAWANYGYSSAWAAKLTAQSSNGYLALSNYYWYYGVPIRCVAATS